MKQVVVETRKNGNVDIATHYDFDPDLVGKKEREEVTIGNITKYWVRVADDRPECELKIPTKKEIRAKKREADKNRAIEIRNQLLEKYRLSVELNGCVIVEDSDKQLASELCFLKNKANVLDLMTK